MSAAQLRPALPRLSVTVGVEFSAAHRLTVEGRDAAWNDATYGPCARPNGHGHVYRLEATVQGAVSCVDGFVADARQIAGLLGEAVVRPCHLRHLNHDVPFLAGLNPTAENLVCAFANVLTRRMSAGRLSAVTLHETPKNAASWIAPNVESAAG